MAGEVVPTVVTARFLDEPEWQLVKQMLGFYATRVPDVANANIAMGIIEKLNQQDEVLRVNYPDPVRPSHPETQMKFNVRTWFLVITFIACLLSLFDFDYRSATADERGHVWARFMQTRYGVSYSWDDRYRQLILCGPTGTYFIPE
jgi:hypothetical protein